MKSRNYERNLCSVVCTTYNHALFARDAIASIAAQTWANIEIIVVDDGSTDGNVQAIKEAFQNLSIRTALIAQENTGSPALNANRALDLASGEFCCLMSLDDLLLSDCIATKLSLMSKDKSVVFVGNNTYFQIEKVSNGWEGPFLKENLIASGCHGTPEECLELEFNNIGTYLLQGTVFRTDFLRSIGGFDEDVTGDDLNLRTKVWVELIRRPNLRFKFLNSPGFLYRKHPSNLNRDIFRQVMTVIDWSSRYFPERPLPSLAREWLFYFFDKCLSKERDTQLRQVLSKSEEVRLLHHKHTASWRYRTRAVAHVLTRYLRRR